MTSGCFEEGKTSMTKWHPIRTEKDLPEKDRNVLVTVRGHVEVAWWWRYRGDPDIEWSCFPDPSAWAELPEPYRRKK